MMILEFPQFQPADLKSPPKSLGDYKRAIAVLAVLAPLVISAGLMTTGTIMLLIRHKLIGWPLAIPALIALLLVALTLNGLFRRKKNDVALIQRRVTLMSPLRVELDHEQFTVRMPIGSSTYAYANVKQWRQTPLAAYLIVKGRGAFVLPRRCIADDELKAAAKWLQDRGVRIRR